MLLLDDVFSELDPERSDALLASLPAGQVLLTTAGPLPSLGPARGHRPGRGRQGPAVSRWRPLPGQPGEQPPRPVGDSLAGLAERLGAPPPALLTAVFADWEHLVGPAIAAHARPLSLSRRVLVIGADHPGWATQLRYFSAELLRAAGRRRRARSDRAGGHQDRAPGHALTARPVAPIW